MPEDWEKIRGKNEHFTEAEKALIRKRFGEGKTIMDVARELLASTRTIQHHFSLLRAEGVGWGAKPEKKQANYSARLYKPVSWDLE